jgi:putative hemolysin
VRYVMAGLLLFALLAGCVAQPEVSGDGTGLPNPASVNCVDKGYSLELRTDESGGQYGVCKYAGMECEEWALYRGDCCFQDSDCTCEEGTPLCENQECRCITEEPEVPEEEPEEIPEEEPEEDETEDEMLPPYSGKTVEEFLDDTLADIRADFFLAHDGFFTTKTVKWTLSGEDMPPDWIPIGGTAGLENAVQFNGESSNKIRGFGFILLTPEGGGLAEAGGIAVFNARDTILDTYYENPGLDLDMIFSFNTKVYELHNCGITGKEQYLASDDSWITNYVFECGYGEQTA